MCDSTEVFDTLHKVNAMVSL